MKKRKKGFKPRRDYYDPSTSPQPRKIVDGSSAKIAKVTRQIRRAQQRGG